MRSKYIWIVFVIIVLSITFFALYSNESNNITDSSKIDTGDNVYVYFIDVGQGDSILITSKYGNMLIDAGEVTEADTVAKFISSKGITDLDYVVATHPHSDHIGGLANVINTFNVKKVIMPKITNNTVTFEKLMNSIKNKNIKPIIPKYGDIFTMGEIKFLSLNPYNESYIDLNNYSVVLKMTYGSTSYFFGGDAEKEVEKDILGKKIDISADVYKVSHHGSRTSSSDSFVKALSPKAAIISCAKVNDYGHPHKETLDTLKKYNIQVFITGLLGTITTYTDGKQIFINDKLLVKSVSSQQTTKEYVDKNGRGTIKGNINSKGEKKYHLPGGKYYDKTVAEKYFKTEQEAIKDGFQKSGQ